jgi:hypothetical protein
MEMKDVAFGSCLQHRTDKTDQPLVIKVNPDSVVVDDGEGNQKTLTAAQLAVYDEVMRMGAEDMAEYPQD